MLLTRKKNNNKNTKKSNYTWREFWKFKQHIKIQYMFKHYVQYASNRQCLLNVDDTTGIVTARRCDAAFTLVWRHACHLASGLTHKNI